MTYLDKELVDLGQRQLSAQTLVFAMAKRQVQHGRHLARPALLHVQPAVRHEGIGILAPVGAVAQDAVDVLAHLRAGRQRVARHDVARGRDDLLEGEGRQGRVEAHGLAQRGLQVRQGGAALGVGGGRREAALARGRGEFVYDLAVGAGVGEEAA